MGFDIRQIRVANLMVAVEEVLDAFVDGPQQLGQINARCLTQHRRVGRHFPKRKPPTQRNVQQGNGAVGSVHGGDNKQVDGYAKPLLRVGQRDPQFIVGTEPFVGFQQRNQIAEHTGHIGPVHLINEQVMRRCAS